MTARQSGLRCLVCILAGHLLLWTGCLVNAFPTTLVRRHACGLPQCQPKHPRSWASAPTTANQPRAGPLHVFFKPPPPPPPPPSAASVINAQIKDLAKHSTLAGHVRNAFAKLRISPEKARLIFAGMGKFIHWEELFFFYFMGWLFVPILAIPNNYLRSKVFPNSRPFRLSYTRLVADHLAQLSRIGFVVYIVDILRILLRALGFKFSQLNKMPNVVARCLLIMWSITRVSALKRYILAMKTRNNPGDLMGSADLVDRLIDAFIYGIGTFVLIDSLQTDFGAAAKGFAALGGVGTIVLSLASQGLVSQVFHGLFLATSNKFRKGDVIKFGEDGNFGGLIAHLGWTETLIRGSDGVMVSVPNKNLADQAISNLSRIQISSVKQELRFKYSDADKLPKVLQDIKDEIREACPQVIDDGTRPFRAFWTGYGTTGLEVTIEAHFRLKLLGDPFWQNRQNMLVAINKAVKKNDMELVRLMDEELLNAMYKNTK